MATSSVKCGDPRLGVRGQRLGRPRVDDHRAPQPLVDHDRGADRRAQTQSRSSRLSCRTRPRSRPAALRAGPRHDPADAVAFELTTRPDRKGTSPTAAPGGRRRSPCVALVADHGRRGRHRGAGRPPRATAANSSPEARPRATSVATRRSAACSSASRASAARLAVVEIAVASSSVNSASRSSMSLAQAPRPPRRRRPSCPRARRRPRSRRRRPSGSRSRGWRRGSRRRSRRSPRSAWGGPGRGAGRRSCARSTGQLLPAWKRMRAIAPRADHARVPVGFVAPDHDQRHAQHLGHLAARSRRTPPATPPRRPPASRSAAATPRAPPAPRRARAAPARRAAGPRCR